MTANDLRYNILLGVDSLFQGTAPGYNNKQISAIINKAQRRVFKDRAKLFEKDEVIRRMLAPLIMRGTLAQGQVVVTVDPTITAFPHSTSLLSAEFFTLPDDLGYLVEESVNLEIDNVVGDPVIVFPITYDYFTKNYRSRYKKPHDKLVWRMDTRLDAGDPVVEIIYPDTHTISDYFIAYLRYPIDIVVDTVAPINQTDCEIPNQTFQDAIVAESIKIIVAALNEEGYQVANAESNFDQN